MSPTIQRMSTILQGTADSATDTLNMVLSASNGSPTMSDTDVKAALIMTHRALQYQMLLNDELMERIDRLENKKLFGRK